MYLMAIVMVWSIATVNGVPTSSSDLTSQSTVPANNTDDNQCTIRDNEVGKCVPKYLCNNGTIIKNGVGLLNFRGKIGGKRSSPSVEDASSNEGCKNLLACCEVPKSESKTIPSPSLPQLKPYNGNCGKINAKGLGSLTSKKNNSAEFGEFPWIVAITREILIGDKKIVVYVCGGSLIHPKVVITSANCVTSYTKSSTSKLKICAGAWDSHTKDQTFPRQERNISKIVIHPAHHENALYNDIAVLILDVPINDSYDHIGYICLPPAGEAEPDSRCFASGWGKDVFGSIGSYQTILKKVELPIVERSKCETDLRKTILGEFFELHHSFICAGGEPKRDMCTGDGGSPLACPIKENSTPDHYMLSGIVSWGIECGEINVPGVYTHVGALREWIDEQLTKNDIDMISYFSENVFVNGL
ncbi:phenoloxidase-activating factor 2-like [Arctopsyche grandis]|uniref:phenoloxidase-activating factor 2-like n=1 Tax=Arctopsyche grandis TaxID=121162 RepID=UPI00406D86C8